MSNTKVIACGCRHTDQDAMYGNGMRVHNETSVKGAVQGQHKWRCTVCKDEKFSYD